MSDNTHFMEQELCNGTLNDRLVDTLHKKRQPKHWSTKQARTESVVVARKGMLARVEVQHSHDPDEPLVAGGYALLEGLNPSERRALLDEAPPLAVPPLPTDTQAGAGSLMFSSRPSGRDPKAKGRAGQKRQRPAGAPSGKRSVAPTGPLSFVDRDEEDEEYT